MNLTPAFNRPRPTWRDEVLAAIILPPMIVALIVWELWKAANKRRGPAHLKGDGK